MCDVCSRAVVRRKLKKDPVSLCVLIEQYVISLCAAIELMDEPLSYCTSVNTGLYNTLKYCRDGNYCTVSSKT